MKSVFLRLFVTLSVGLAQSFAREPDRDCVDWFRHGKVELGAADCKLKCTTLMTDLGTFNCPDQCEILCKPKAKESILTNLVFYPGLTPAEKQLLVNNPKQAYLVYKQKSLAEDSTSRNFPDQELNDESDAFRHFVWSGLLTKELGRETAKEYLDAHEENPLQSERERQMDSFNNEYGQSAAEILIKNKNWSPRNLESKAIESLRSKKLQVLKPGLPIPKEPK